MLVLGSMPGAASLEKQQYYAHPRNSFWPIMAQLLDFDPGESYQRRLEHLCDAGIALWDVLAQCERRGSLDADIVRDSIVANDFAGFFARHNQITRVFFNGGKAGQLFRQHAWSQLQRVRDNLALHGLPSTSPAHASMTPQEKLNRWRVLLDAEAIVDAGSGK